MFSKTFYKTSAIGLCMSVLPMVTYAQTSSGSSQQAADMTQEDGLFVPMVNECVTAPDAETCGKVRAVITECAEDLDDALCDVLFVSPSDVFETPALTEEAQAALTEASEAIAIITFEDVEEGEIDDVIEGTRADAERSMLRGDENLMSHSGPPSVEEN